MSVVSMGLPQIRAVKTTRLWVLVSLAVLLVRPPTIAAAAEITRPKPVVITTDCGADMDDQWAIAHMALSPKLKLYAVIGNFAPEPHNLKSTDTSQCARQTLQVVGRLAKVPVYPGSDHALTAGSPPARSRGVDALIRISRAFSPEHRLTVVGLGPITDAASALLIDPDIAKRIEIVALAFDHYPQGGDGWNVRNDVIAWQAVLSSGIPVATASGYVALQYLNLTRTQSRDMMSGRGLRGAYFACLHSSWIDTFTEQAAQDAGGPDRWPVWDEAITAIVLGMTTEQQHPRPLLNDDISFRFPNPSSNAPFLWVDTIDRDRVFRDFVALLGPVQGLRKSFSPPAPSSGRPLLARSDQTISSADHGPWWIPRKKCGSAARGRPH